MSHIVALELEHAREPLLDAHWCARDTLASPAEVVVLLVFFSFFCIALCVQFAFRNGANNALLRLLHAHIHDENEEKKKKI